MDLLRFAQIDGLDAILADEDPGTLTGSWCDLMEPRVRGFPRNDIFPVLESTSRILVESLSAALARSPSLLPGQNSRGMWIGLFETTDDDNSDTICAYYGLSDRTTDDDVEWMVGCTINEQSYTDLGDLTALVAQIRSRTAELYTFYDICLPLVPLAAALFTMHRKTELLSGFQEIGFGWDDGDYRTFRITPDRLISLPT